MSDTKADTEPVVDAEKMPPPTTQQKADLMKLEEEKLKSKFPHLPGRPAAHGGHSSFLQKRLAKGQKFFDSGDYQMAKQSNHLVPGGPVAHPTLPLHTGKAHPTPSTVTARKTSIIPPHYDHSTGDQHQQTHPEGPQHHLVAHQEEAQQLSA